MIDPRILREDPEAVRSSLRRRGSDIDLDAIIAMEEKARATQAQAEQARAEQKEAGKRIAGLSGPEKEKAITEVAGLAEKVKSLTSEADTLYEEFEQRWLTVPNL
ncbi:MAG TPA: serine--tRNA ligase, partial [Acidimicrobiia bacterium]|nr:serine--tRNA ligase [Acidimicrobiia bacterium]